ncbi:MAG: MmgE/PrpD family protein [Burkholderiales bacterium]|nr:MmgE/PrpD family protein [Burkholderiales bacterium]
MQSKINRKSLMAGDTPTAALAHFASAVKFSELSEDEQQQTTRHFLDTVGACVAGLDQPLVTSIAQLMQDFDSSAEQGCTIPVIGSFWKTNIHSAAYLMAISCHAIEVDDGNREGSIHPGTAVIPAALAMGYHCDADFETLMAAVVAGYEVAVSVAEVLHPHASKRGFQTTPVAGVLAAAACAARLLKLNPAQTESAIGIAASSSAGIFAYLTGGGNIKKLHPGQAARQGIWAALLAQQGAVQGPMGVLESKAGIFKSFGGIADWRHGNGAARTELAVVRSYLKPYPCCRHIHPAIDAALDLRLKHRISPDQIKCMEVGTYEAAMPHAKLSWETLNMAQLSFPFVMAVAMHKGNVDLSCFSSAALCDASIAQLAKKVVVSVDAECQQNYPVHGPARVRIILTNGDEHSQYVSEPMGSPDMPISDIQLIEKFQTSLQSNWPAVQSAAWASQLYQAKFKSVRTMVDALTLAS